MLLVNDASVLMCCRRDSNSRFFVYAGFFFLQQQLHFNSWNARTCSRIFELCSHAEQSSAPYNAIARSMWAYHDVEVASPSHTWSPKPCACRTNVRTNSTRDTCARQVGATGELCARVDCTDRWLVQAALRSHWMCMFVCGTEHCQTANRQRSLG